MQNHEESIYINKVNEMQIKTSRFEQVPHNGYPHLFNAVPFEDFIPNEEPLIHVREFRGNNQNNHSRRGLL